MRRWAPTTVPGRARAVPVLVTVMLALAAGGCAESAGSGGSRPPNAQSQSTSRADLVDKLAAIARDECATQPAAQVYPRCARFTREVANATVAARSVGSGEAAVTAAADSVDGAVDRLTKDGCLLSAQQGSTGGPQVCGPDLALLQEALRALRSALGPPR